MDSRTLYIAPKPTLRMSWFQQLASRLIGGSVGKLIISAQNNPELKVEAVRLYNQFIADKKSIISVDRLNIQTHDGASLDTVEVKLSGDQDGSQRPYIIFIGGVGSCYERSLGVMADLAESINAISIGFNLRGVCESTGAAYSKNDSITDGIAQVQRLLAQGVNPRYIFLKGESYGSAIAAEVCDYFHNAGTDINVFCGRAFSNLHDEISGLVRDGVSQTVSTLAKPIIKSILYSANWNADTYHSFANIPEQNREYLLVRSSKEIRRGRTDDPVVKHTESLHYALRREQKMLNVSSSIDDSVADDIKQKSRARKFITESPDANGHIVPLVQLKNYNNTSGLSFFCQFVLRRNQADASKIASAAEAASTSPASR